MRPLRFSSIIALLTLVTGCTKESPMTPSAEQVVVQAYLYAGEPVSDIRLTGTIPLGSQVTKAPPVNDAEVSLMKKGVEYKLDASPGDSGYYHYPKTDLLVQAGDDFQILVRRGGLTIEAETTVPPAPDSVRVSSDTLVLSTVFGRPTGGLGGEDSTGTLTVSWKRQSSALYYVVVESVEANPDTIATSGFFRGGGAWMRRMISTPTNDDHYVIRRTDVSFLGRHEAKVYRVNQEYADLYGSRQQDSRDLNEPLTNIKNGLGVFSAFNSTAVNFDVIQR
jgi:hypothetical protein